MLLADLSGTQGLSLYLYETLCTRFVFDSGLAGAILAGVCDGYHFDPGEFEEIMRNISLIYKYDLEAARLDQEFKAAAQKKRK